MTIKAIMGLQKQCKKPYDKQLINLEYWVFTGKFHIRDMPYWLCHCLVNIAIKSWFKIFL